MQGYKFVCVSSNERYLLIFADYIYREFQIKLEVKTVRDTFDSTLKYELWLGAEAIASQDVIIQAFQDYQQYPTADKYILASWNVGSTHNKKVTLTHNSLLNDLKQQANPLTVILVFITLFVFILQTLRISSVNFLLFYPVNSEQYLQFWRFFSHIFLHFSVLHLVVNLMWFWYLGNQIELRSGRIKLISIILFSAIISGYGQNIATGYLFGGLSGVIYAFTGYCWLYGVMKPSRGLYLPTPVMLFALIWLVVGYVPIFDFNLGNIAHFIGLLVGLVMAFIDVSLDKTKNDN